MILRHGLGVLAGLWLATAGCESGNRGGGAPAGTGGNCSDASNCSGSSDAMAGTTYYVAPNGSVGGAGTRESPWTIDKAVEVAGPGDLVLFLDGVYESQSLRLNRSGEPGAPVTFRADEAAVPILQGADGNSEDGVTAVSVVHDIRIEGLWLRNWRYGGIGIAWNYHGAQSIEVRHCVADQNLMNGISLYWVRDFTVEDNIVSRNGWGPDSWSSNVNMFAPQGTNNVVRRNVAFHGVDTSSNSSDGNGFIVDLAIDQGSVAFENNIGFGNGGACIAVTDSRGARLVNNSCADNVHQNGTGAGELNFVDTCRDVVSGVPVNGGHYALLDAVVRNNAVVAGTAHTALNRYACGASTAWVNSTLESNSLSSGDGTAQFVSSSTADFRPQTSGGLIDVGTNAGAPATDIGFDPKCIKAEGGQKYPWWTHAPDEAYIRSIGGIKACFKPGPRPVGATTDIGAYESTASVLNCASNWSPVSPLAFDNTCQGYATMGSYRGYVYTVSDAAMGGGSSVCPSCSAGKCTPAISQLCARGTAGQVVGTSFDTYWGIALGWNLSQSHDATCVAGAEGTVDLNGLTIHATLSSPQPALRIKLKVAGKEYCADIGGQTTVSLPISSFAHQCWLGASAAPITPSDAASVTGVEFFVPTNTTAAQPFDFCVTSLQLD